MTAGAIHILRFGAFELDLRTSELRRAGVLIKLAPQQLRLLRYLAERPSQICTRDQLRQEIWDAGTFVDFDRGLTVAIAGIRAALHDDPDAPRFIQTIPRKGYRFIAPVEPVTAAPPPPAAARPKPPSRTHFRLALGFLALTIVTAALLFHFDSRTTMLAVLPFENLDGGDANAPLLNGMADELVTQLGAIDPERLGVIGRTSVLRLAASKPSLPQLRRELGVDYVVEGSFRSEGDTQRIAVRLVKTETQSQVWSRTFQTGAGALETQQDVAAQSSVEIGARLFPPNRPMPRRTHDAIPAAREAWLNGRYILQTRGRGGNADALRQFTLAVERDPRWADAWISVAEGHLARAFAGAPAPEAFAAARDAAGRALRLDKEIGARDAAGRALRLDKEIAEAHNVLGNVLFWHDWKWADARREFDRALELNASLARAHHDRALLDIVSGQPERGIAGLRRAIALDPLSPHVNLDAGWLFLQAHHFEEAERAARRALELEPGLEEARACIARAQLYRGHPSPETMATLEAVAAGTGNPWYRALANAATGRDDAALAALEEASAARDPAMVMLKTEPAFTRLHGTPRFQKLLPK